MRGLISLLFVFIFSVADAQIKSNGYNDFIWSQNKEQIKNLVNCNSKQAGTGFEICEYASKDSLFLGKYKYKNVSIRMYQNKLSELQFDLNHADVAAIIAELSIQIGKPEIKEKKQISIEGEEASIGYIWELGDTYVLIINDGRLSPAICVLSSKKIKNTYPINTLSLEQLIFE